jgi:hypothetical protein
VADDRDRIPGSPGSLPEGGSVRDSGTQREEQPASPRMQPPAPRSRFSGVIRLRESAVYLVSGGIEVELDPASTARFRALNGRAVTITGQQRGLLIINAELICDTPLPARPAKPSRDIHAEGALPFATVLAAIDRNRDRLMKYRGVVKVRPGYRFVKGKITSEPAVVVSVVRKLPEDRLSAADRLPKQLDDGRVWVDVTPATPWEQLRQRQGTETETLGLNEPRYLIDELVDTHESPPLLELTRQIAYTPPDGDELEEITAAMSITCHVSPDAGWRMLRPFLGTTTRSLHVGMYDFTAPHVLRTVTSMLRNSNAEFQMVLDPGESLPGENDPDSTKADDLHETSVIRSLKRAGGQRVSIAPASTGAGGLFANAYHIKVAVRDRNSLWLSSGNWQSSNQPNIDFLADDADTSLIPRYNREWHVVVEHQGLARTFQRFLDHDFRQASEAPEAASVPVAMPDLFIDEAAYFEEERARLALQVFAPQKFTFSGSNHVRIMPLLSPDNYHAQILDLLKTHRRSLGKFYFQNQSLNPVKRPTDEFQEMLDILAELSNDHDKDVRFIFRDIGSVRKKIESLQLAGFNMSRVRIQRSCHTKGIIIDSEILVIGSHNFSNDGVQYNRDASLIIYDARVAKYFEDVFLHDWDRLARGTVREGAMPLLADERESASSDMVRLQWRDVEEG